MILTKNEAIHLPRMLRSIEGITDQIYIVDSYSDDATVEIAERFGARVYQREFQNQADQFQWALESLPLETQWVMRLDADEIVEPALADEIQIRLPQLGNGISGIYLKRKQIFMNRWVRWGGCYPLLLLRIWRRGHATMEQRWMDEHLILNQGSSVVFKGNLVDQNLNNLHAFISKHNDYATREALDVIAKRHQLTSVQPTVHLDNSAFQTSYRRLLKLYFYNQLPYPVSSTLYFFYRYFMLLGFLDGRSGLVYHFLQGYWYRFLIGAKVEELEREMAECESKEEMVSRIHYLTGYTLR